MKYTVFAFVAYIARADAKLASNAEKVRLDIFRERMASCSMEQPEQCGQIVKCSTRGE